MNYSLLQQCTRITTSAVKNSLNVQKLPYLASCRPLDMPVCNIGQTFEDVDVIIAYFADNATDLHCDSCVTEQLVSSLSQQFGSNLVLFNEHDVFLMLSEVKTKFVLDIIICHIDCFKNVMDLCFQLNIFLILD